MTKPRNDQSLLVRGVPEATVKARALTSRLARFPFSWEKGTVENTIGLVRSFLPKKTSLKDVTQSELNTVAYVLNSRPRKKLNY